MVDKVMIVPKGQDAEEIVQKLKQDETLQEIFRKSSKSFIDVSYDPELEDSVKEFCDEHNLKLHDIPKATLP